MGCSHTHILGIIGGVDTGHNYNMNHAGTATTRWPALAGKDGAMSSVQTKLDTSMSVKELMEALSTMDENATVLFACDYGDHTHTEQALTITDAEELESCDLYETAYSKSGLAVREEEGGDEADPTPIVVLR